MGLNWENEWVVVTTCVALLMLICIGAFLLSEVLKSDEVKIINACNSACYIENTFGLEGKKQEANCAQACINAFVNNKNRSNEFKNSKIIDENWTTRGFLEYPENNCYKDADGCNTICCDDKNRNCSTTLMYCGIDWNLVGVE